MTSAFLTGFTLGFSLILAIGAQNAFVLRNAINRSNVGKIVLFCALSDAFLIAVGVSGISILLNRIIIHYSTWMLYFAALWLFIYGILRLRAAFCDSDVTYTSAQSSSNSKSLFIHLFILTFLNPHVYLDTVVLIGTISTQYRDELKIAFSLGAIFSSFIFFFSLGYGARYASKFLTRPNSLRRLDLGIALLMFGLALNFFFEAQTV